MNQKKGHQAPRGYRVNRYNSIEISGTLHYCDSHNFVYDCDEQRRRLHEGLPCFYTDKRFKSSYSTNFFLQCYLFQDRNKPISLKSCIRRTMSCKNIPVGTMVEFGKSWYYPGKRFKNGYLFKVTQENRMPIDYEVNVPSFFNNFKACDRSKDLVNILRDNGFLVQVFNENPDRLIGYNEGEIAIAYGHGIRVGISSNDDPFYGYFNGCDNILWDKFEDFDKWSRCYEIPKTYSTDSIIKILTNSNDEHE